MGDLDKVLDMGQVPGPDEDDTADEGCKTRGAFAH